MNPIRERLADLAEEVSIVDLHARSLRASRRLGITRALAAAAAALIVLATLGLAGLTVRGRERSLPPIAPPPVTTTGTPTGNPTLLPTPSPDPPMAAHAMRPWVSVVTEPMPGRAFYQLGDTVLRTGEGTRSTSSVISDDPCIRNTMTASPDGRWLAWVTGGRDDIGEQVVIVDTARLGDTRVNAPAWCYGSRPLMFSPDSQSIVYFEGTRDGGTSKRLGAVRYRLSDGQTSPVAQADLGPVPSAGGGTYTALREGDDIVVRGANGAQVHRCTRPDGDEPYFLLGLSADGRSVSTAVRPTDVVNNRAANRVLDTTTCQPRALANAGEEITSVLFGASGRYLITTRATATLVAYYRLFNADGTTVAQTPFPNTNDAVWALAYVG